MGYGDYYPVTTGGRLVGFLMLTVGVALFATFSGFLANIVSLGEARPPKSQGQRRTSHEALRDVERLLAEQQRAIETLRTRVAELG